MYSPNFSAENKTFHLSLHDNGDNSYLLVNGKGVTKFKAKDSEIKAYPLLLGNIAVDAVASNTNDFSYDFSVNYDAIANDKILDIHKYLMKKIYNIKCLILLKKRL